jgi:hypothetical protein
VHHGNLTKEMAQGLLVLQERIKKAGIPPSKLDETLNIATWNIREFGKKPRLKASLHYIAEIIGQFDLYSPAAFLVRGAVACEASPVNNWWRPPISASFRAASWWATSTFRPPPGRCSRPSPRAGCACPTRSPA